MNLRVREEIIKSLRLRGTPRDCNERLSRIHKGQWEGIVGWLVRSGLALYWWSRIKSAVEDSAVPETIRARLDEYLRENRARLSAMDGEFRALLKLIEEARIPCAVLKGFSLVPEYCPDAALRNQYDFDFLVDASSVPGIDKALRLAGFIRKPQRSSFEPIEYFHSLRRPIVPKNLERVFSPGLHRMVEVHTSLWESNADKIRFTLPERSLDRAVLKNWNGIPFISLAPEEVLVLQVLHIFRHILNNQCRLSHLFELATFLNQRADGDPIWPAFQNVVSEDERLMEAAGIVFALASGLFHVSVPKQARAFSVERLSAASAFWVRRYGMDSALSNFSGSKSSLYLHSLFVDSDSDWREIRRRRLFPIRRPATVARASTRNMASRLSARARQFAHVARRSWFHGAAALKYVWGLPEWQRHSNSSAGLMCADRAEMVVMARESTSGE